MTNDEIQLLYIEFSFLGYSGADMETVSLRKPTPPEQKLTYNFQKSKLALSRGQLQRTCCVRYNET